MTSQHALGATCWGRGSGPVAAGGQLDRRAMGTQPVPRSPTCSSGLACPGRAPRGSKKQTPCQLLRMENRLCCEWAFINLLYLIFFYLSKELRFLVFSCGRRRPLSPRLRCLGGSQNSALRVAGSALQEWTPGGRGALPGLQEYYRHEGARSLPGRPSRVGHGGPSTLQRRASVPSNDHVGAGSPAAPPPAPLPGPVWDGAGLSPGL